MTEFPSVLHGGPILYRDALQVEAVDSAEFTVRGRAVPYGKTVVLTRGLEESFEPGAFARQVKAPTSWARVKMLYAHDPTEVPIGRAALLEERDDGLHVGFQLSKRLIDEPGSKARQVWAALEEGDLDELSIGFRSIVDRPEYRGETMHVRRIRCHLDEVSIVPFGAYGRDARVTEVRDLEGAEAAEELARMQEWRDRFARLAL